MKKLIIASNRLGGGGKSAPLLGFTLAEVLITLGIIGVVAAMTMPVLIQNNRNKELHTGLKTAYSLISQALNKMNTDKGDVIKPEDYNTVFFYDEYKKYFKILYDCSIMTPNPSICLERGIKDENGLYTDNAYKTFNNNSAASHMLDDGQFVITNGMLIMIENPQEDSRKRLFISVDINGKKRLPNRLGHDVFTFQISERGKLLPMGVEGSEYSEEEYCSTTSTNNLNGIACTAKALSDKNYWKNLP